MQRCGNAGYAINPARDFGPRLFAYLAGWGEHAIPGPHGYLWIPIVGPLVGAALGALLYDFFIGDVLHAREAAPGSPAEFDASSQETSVKD